MAHLRKRGRTWTIRQKGYKAIARVFDLKAETER